MTPAGGIFRIQFRPLLTCCVSVLPFGPAGPGRALGNDWREQDLWYSTRLFDTLLHQGDRADAVGITRDGAQGGAEPPHRVQVRARVYLANFGAWVEVLTEILEQEAKLPKRERRSTQRLFEELRGRGYDGAHDSVHRFVRAWRNERVRVPVHAYVPMSSRLAKPISLT